MRATLSQSSPHALPTQDAPPNRVFAWRLSSSRHPLRALSKIFKLVPVFRRNPNKQNSLPGSGSDCIGSTLQQQLAPQEQFQQDRSDIRVSNGSVGVGISKILDIGQAYCIECAMRDENVLDIDVRSPGVWERESDVFYRDLCATEEPARAQDHSLQSGKISREGKGGEKSVTYVKNARVSASAIWSRPGERPNSKGNSLTKANVEMLSNLRLQPEQIRSRRFAIELYVHTQRFLLGPGVDFDERALAQAQSETHYTTRNVRNGYSHNRFSAGVHETQWSQTPNRPCIPRRHSICGGMRKAWEPCSKGNNATEANVHMLSKIQDVGRHHCTECAMRDEDVLDIDVRGPGVWERESDVFYRDLCAAEEPVQVQLEDHSPKPSHSESGKISGEGGGREESVMYSKNARVSASAIWSRPGERPNSKGNSLTKANVEMLSNLWLQPEQIRSRRFAIELYVHTQRFLLGLGVYFDERALAQSESHHAQANRIVRKGYHHNCLSASVHETLWSQTPNQPFIPRRHSLCGGTPITILHSDTSPGTGTSSPDSVRALEWPREVFFLGNSSSGIINADTDVDESYPLGKKHTQNQESRSDHECSVEKAGPHFSERAGPNTKLTTVQAMISGSSSSDRRRNSSITPVAGKYGEGLENLLKQLSHVDLTDDVYDLDANLDAHGGYCDVFHAKSRIHGGMVVAVKRIRVHIIHHKDAAKMIFRELTIWSSLNHKNILPLLGYAMHGKYPAFVSEWMVNGTMKKYLESHPEVRVMDMANGVAAGLLYLHNRHIIHSDLKSENVLMSMEGRPLLADFGISRIMSASLFVTTTTTAPKGSVRWMACELLVVDPKEEQLGRSAMHTKMTDVWSFGMVVYELLTSQYPYAHLRHDLHVSMAIINGQTPEKPTSQMDSEDDLLWLVCQACWRRKPSHRPAMKRICNTLKHGAATYILAQSLATECLAFKKKLHMSRQLGRLFKSLSDLALCSV